MRVLMTTDAVGGVWTYALDLAAALASHGVEVVLASMGPLPSPGQVRDVGVLPNVTLHARPFALEWMPDPWADVERAGDWLLHLADGAAIDLVHLNGYAHAALPFEAPVLTGAHSCVLSWWRAVKGKDAPAAEWSRYRRAVTAGLLAADGVVAPTRAMLAELVTIYEPLGRTCVIPNGRAAAGYRSAEAKQPIILTAGRLWDEAKNVAALAAVAPALPWPVSVAGDDVGPDGAVAVSLPNVNRLGRLDPAALADQYARAAIYALPARYEPFGLSALEAALSGCALVLGDIPSLREVWGDAAVYIHPDDHDGLLDTLKTLIADPARRAAFASRARARAADFTPRAMATAYARLYGDLVRTAALFPHTATAGA